MITKRPLLATVVFAALLLAALLVPLPATLRNMDAAGNFLHVLTFAVLAALVFRVVQPNGSAVVTVVVMLICWSGITGFGLVTEWLQHWVTRNPSWGDVWANACGVAGGILWVQARSISSRRLRIGLFVCVSLVVIAGVAGPLLVV